ECVSSFIPIMGPLHVSLNSRETVMLLFYDFFNLSYKCIFGKNKKLANKPRPWRINLLLQLMSDAWKNVAPYIMRKFDFSCSRDVEYLTLKSLLDDTIPLVLNVYATIFRSGDWDGYIEACVRIWCLFARFKRRNYNKASIFLLELFTDVKNNTGKSKWTKRDRNKFSCHLATLNIDVDQRHLPMAFSSEYPPFDPSEKCHLQDSCKMLQSTSDHFVSL